MSLVGDVAAHLRERGTPFAVIGAAALAAHGVSRATLDVDVLVVDATCLEPRGWDGLRATAVDVEIRPGDADDPLAGVVRLRRAGASPVDVVVGRPGWPAGVLHRARPVWLEDVTVPLATASDLVILKLYAGGHQDAWDIGQLLAGPDRHAIVTEVEERLGALPPDSQTLWRRIREADASSRCPS